MVEDQGTRKTLEHCIKCTRLTGRAGAADDSLFCKDCEGGPLCIHCAVWGDNDIRCTACAATALDAQRKEGPTETVDRLFLELSQFTTATTAKETELVREYERLSHRHSSLMGRARDGAQVIIDKIGSAGPEGVEQTARRAVDRIRALEREVEELKTVERCDTCGSDKLYHGPPDCPDCGAPNCCPSCCRVAVLEREVERLTTHYERTVRLVHEDLDAAGVLSAARVCCDDDSCRTQLQHRVRGLLAKRRETDHLVDLILALNIDEGLSPAALASLANMSRKIVRKDRSAAAAEAKGGATAQLERPKPPRDHLITETGREIFDDPGPEVEEDSDGEV